MRNGHLYFAILYEPLCFFPFLHILSYTQFYFVCVLCKCTVFSFRWCSSCVTAKSIWPTWNNGRVIAVVCSCTILRIFLTSDTFFCFVHIAINCVCWWNMFFSLLRCAATVIDATFACVYATAANENTCKIHTTWRKLQNKHDKELKKILCTVSLAVFLRSLHCWCFRLYKTKIMGWKKHSYDRSMVSNGSLACIHLI